MKIIIQIIICFLIQSSFLHAATCQFQMKFGKHNVVLNQTNYRAIVNEYGFTESFDYYEYGSLGLCYKASDIFVIFGFEPRGRDNILKVIEISIFPPSGFHESFCKEIPFDRKFFKIDDKFIGYVKKKNHSTLFDKQISIIEINDNCYVMKEFFYFGGGIANLSIGLSDTNL